MTLIKTWASLSILIATVSILTACSNTKTVDSPSRVNERSHSSEVSNLADPIMAISRLSEHQAEWKGTRYRLGGNSKSGIDCSGFMQVTFRELFGIHLPRTTTEQAQKGKQIPKSQLRTGDLVFFKTGRGPNGKHVGVYVKNGQFLHASSKKGVIYSDMNSPYWSKVFWQARRL